MRTVVVIQLLIGLDGCTRPADAPRSDSEGQFVDVGNGDADGDSSRPALDPDFCAELISEQSCRSAGCAVVRSTDNHFEACLFPEHLTTSCTSPAATGFGDPVPSCSGQTGDWTCTCRSGVWKSQIPACGAALIAICGLSGGRRGYCDDGVSECRAFDQPTAPAYRCTCDNGETLDTDIDDCEQALRELCTPGCDNDSGACAPNESGDAHICDCTRYAVVREIPDAHCTRALRSACDLGSDCNGINGFCEWIEEQIVCTCLDGTATTLPDDVRSCQRALEIACDEPTDQSCMGSGSSAHGVCDYRKGWWCNCSVECDGNSHTWQRYVSGDSCQEALETGCLAADCE